MESWVGTGNRSKLNGAVCNWPSLLPFRFREKLRFPLALSSGCCNPFSCLILPWLSRPQDRLQPSQICHLWHQCACKYLMYFWVSRVFPQLVPSSWPAVTSGSKSANNSVYKSKSNSPALELQLHHKLLQSQDWVERTSCTVWFFTQISIIHDSISLLECQESGCKHTRLCFHNWHMDELKVSWDDSNS